MCTPEVAPSQNAPPGSCKTRCTMSAGFDIESSDRDNTL